MEQDINRHNLIVRAFEKNNQIYSLTKVYNKITNEEEYFEMRTRLAFYNFRDGFEAGYLCRLNEEGV